MISDILYVLATGSLLIGSALDFDEDQPASYFFVIGSSLFFIKSSMSLYNYKKETTEMSYYDTI